MTFDYDHPKILLVDSYDSFTYNLASLCRLSITNCAIHIIKNDQLPLSELLPLLKYFSAIIVGPGPGSPENANDIGIVKDLWKLAEEHLIPIFGVCLGLQSLGVEFGARLKRLHVVKHGQISRVHHAEGTIFEGVGNIDAVRYHSLHIELAEDGDIEELAWADDEENGRVVMAVKHRTRPFYAVQYHPESVCTNGGGLEVIRNFWRLACQWSKKNGRNTLPLDPMIRQAMGNPWPHSQSSPRRSISPSSASISTTVLTLPTLSVTTVCESFGVLQDSSSFVLLDSAAQPGRFSIIASLAHSSTQITYFIGDTIVGLTHGSVCTREDLGVHDIWSWLTSFMRNKKAHGGSPVIPFWGGLIGSLSYELGVYSSNIPLQHRDVTEASRVPHPDVNLVFVERSVVLDSVTGKVYIQTLIPNDDAWINSAAENLRRAADRDAQAKDHLKPSLTLSSVPTVTLPDKALYISRIQQAKEYLFAGDSYELCLTANTRISVPVSPSSTSWERYKTLRRNNPAPHSAYIRLHPTTLLSSSPERFLSFSRPPGTVCQLRPIKGTVRKGDGITRTVAEHALIGSTKEVAENLMIVDLIRHDLHGVVGDNVVVKQFCQVEEYETVWQLVSVIEGQDSVNLNPDIEVGPEVLRRSLPPGSMTGAPKKRSVEILQTLEDSERSLYSGVFGYWDVGGGGDWSVTIRSCFKSDDVHIEKHCPAEVGSDVARTEEWVIGAGGAITALSDPEAEWEEMVLKLQSVLRAFDIRQPESTNIN